MPHMPGKTNLQKPRYFSMLIHMAYHTYHQHTLLWSLLKENNHRLPHSVIDTKLKDLRQVQFILPKFMSTHKNLMEVHLQTGDSISFREDEFFSDYLEDLDDFGKKLIYSEYIDHGQVGSSACDEAECFYGRHNEGYTKVYEIKSLKTDKALTYEDQVLQPLYQFMESYPYMSTVDLIKVSVQISNAVPIFLRDHNSLQEVLAEQGLYSVDYDFISGQ